MRKTVFRPGMQTVDRSCAQLIGRCYRNRVLEGTKARGSLCKTMQLQETIANRMECEQIIFLPKTGIRKGRLPKTKADAQADKAKF